MVDNYLNDNQILVLDNVYHNIKNDNKIKNKLSLEILIKFKGKLQDFYNKSSFNRDNLTLSDIELDDLINKNIMKYLNKKDKKLSLTYKGIIIIEYKIYTPSSEVIIFLDDLNTKFFDKIMKLSEEPLESIEKVILITLLGLGAFSYNYSIKFDVINNNFYKDAVDIAVNYISSLGEVYNDKTLKQLWNKKIVGEDPVRAEMRRLNKIVFHTEGIYVKEKFDNIHYLDILKDNQIDTYKTIYLLNKIFDKRPLKPDEKDALIMTLDKIHLIEFKIFKDMPPYDRYEIRNQLKKIIESNL